MPKCAARGFRIIGSDLCEGSRSTYEQAVSLADGGVGIWRNRILDASVGTSASRGRNSSLRISMENALGLRGAARQRSLERARSGVCGLQWEGAVTHRHPESGESRVARVALRLPSRSNPIRHQQRAYDSGELLRPG